MVRRLRWAALLTFLVACSEDGGEYLAARDYDQSCQTNEECVRVEECVCGCSASGCPGPFGVISQSATDEFEDDRQAVRASCLQPRTPKSPLSCLVPTPLCVDGACRLTDNPPEGINDRAKEPSEWSRDCTDDLDCGIAAMTDCTLCGCDPEYVALKLGDVEAAQHWDQTCTSYSDDCDQCDEPPQEPDVTARCIEGQCELDDFQSVDFDICDDTADGACQDRDCRRLDLNGQRMADAMCARERVTFCVNADAFFDVTDETPRYHRDGLGIRFPMPGSGWTDCSSSSAPVCDCVF